MSLYIKMSYQHPSVICDNRNHCTSYIIEDYNRVKIWENAVGRKLPAHVDNTWVFCICHILTLLQKNLIIYPKQTNDWCNSMDFKFNPEL